MNLYAVPVLNDNYVWILNHSQRHCIIVDPGEAQPVITFLQQHNLTPQGILITHHHDDHLLGVAELCRIYPMLTLYAPQEVIDKPTLSTIDKQQFHLVKDNDTVMIASITLSVMAVPGHTLGHVAYYSAPYLFCGDTLFSAGCGRIFEGTAAQMYQSITRLASLPDTTLLCCSHEYTLSNLRFAQQILPDDPVINEYLLEIEKIRQQQQSSLPTTLEQQRLINLFLRSDDPILQKSLGFQAEKPDPGLVFTQLRKRKDNS